MANHTKKGFIFFVLCTAMIFFLAGCGEKSQTPATNNTRENVTKTGQSAPKETQASSISAPKPDQDQKGQKEEKEQKKEKNTPKPAAEQKAAVSETKKVAAKKNPVPVQKEVQQKSTKNLFLIEGAGVKNQARFTVSDLQKMKSAFIEDDIFSLNNWGTKKYFHFKGVSLWYLLHDKAGLTGKAKTVKIIGEDGYTISYGIGEVQRKDYIDEQNPEKKHPMFIAWEEDGKMYDPAQGSPFRFVVGQKGPGDINKPNWVQNIKTIRVE